MAVKLSSDLIPQITDARVIVPEDAPHTTWMMERGEGVTASRVWAITRATMKARRRILSDIRIEEEVDERDLPAAPTTDVAPVVRYWDAEIAAAETVEQIHKLEADARATRAFTPDAPGSTLHCALRARRKAIVESAWALDHTPRTRDAEPLEPARPMPRDYLPSQNPAARCASSRKKNDRR